MTETPSETRTDAMLELAIRCLDLTSLDGSETPEQVRDLCDKAIRPDPDDPKVPGVAAVVLYPPFVATASERLKGTDVGVATVIGFPMPKEPLAKRLAEIHAALDAGATEIDSVLDREAFLSGRQREAAEEIERSKEAAGSALLKVILETGELGSSERIREASMLAMTAGADFLKSSTGKVGGGATVATALSMMESARDFREETGRAVGIKVSGGIRKPEQALAYIDLLHTTLGAEWLGPKHFRIGASSLLDELVARLRAERGG
jgi:deoxyribose-phosphate aldolase